LLRWRISITHLSVAAKVFKLRSIFQASIMSLPSLPTSPPGHSWPTDLHKAAGILQEIYTRTSDAAAASNLNLHRIDHYIDRITNEALPLISQTHESIIQLGRRRLVVWLRECIQMYGTLFAQLLQFRAEATETYVQPL
jgi:hypothetical protein